LVDVLTDDVSAKSQEFRVRFVELVQISGEGSSLLIDGVILGFDVICDLAGNARFIKLIGRI
jgi:hypothetical protein